MANRARDLQELFNAIDDARDPLPPPEDLRALAVLMRAQRMCSRAWDRACPKFPTPAADPAWAREFSWDEQVAFVMGRAYQLTVGARPKSAGQSVWYPQEQLSSL